MSAAHHRRKGAHIGREVADGHKALNTQAERYSLSGTSHFRGSGHDIDVYELRADKAPLVAELKARANGVGFGTLEKCLGDYDALFLRRNGAEALVLVSWRSARIIGEVRR